MSTRCYMLCVSSLDPIKNAVGCQDQSLVDAVLKVMDVDEDDEYQEWAESMIMPAKPPKKEPGCWNYFVEPMAEHFGLKVIDLPLDDWKHSYVWDDYHKLADPQLSASSRQLVEHLSAGRPFKGSGIDYDGCVFGWLSASETKTLLEDLKKLDTTDFGDLVDFHDEIVESLEITVRENGDLFLGAH